MQSIRLGDVRYNARNGAFEARVDVIRGDTVYRYPCQVPGPVDMSMDTVAMGLTQHALRMSDSGGSLRSVF
jgi:hypothetical protein